MKHIVLIFVFSIHSITALFSQESQKYDNIWTLNMLSGRYNRIDFSSNPLKIDSLYVHKQLGIGMDAPNASICDRNGKFLFYSNGCAIAGGDTKVLPNGLKINPETVYKSFCFSGGGSYPDGGNQLLFLPHPADTSTFYLFHSGRDDNGIGLLTYQFTKLYYTELNTKPNAGIGDVVKKNVLLTMDSIGDTGTSACKHGNGKDWWVITPTVLKHGYLRTLLTKNGPQYIGKQLIGPSDDIERGEGQSCFSPDGSKYVRTDPFYGIYILDFDRCTGLMSNPIHIDTLEKCYLSGVAISPNSRYLYYTTGLNLYQFDLQAKDIAKSVILIDTYDFFLAPNTVGFFKCQLAPNNKIYVGAVQTSVALSVINDPDEVGKACNFVKYGVILPAEYYVGLPNHSNYRLGAKKGSPCENQLSAIKDNKLDGANIHLYPNPTPTQDKLYVNLDIIYQGVIVTDITGKVIKRIYPNAEQSEYQIDTFDLSNGLYFVIGITTDGRQAAAQRFVVLH